MRKEFVMRGKTDSGLVEVLNFSGYKPGYAFKLTEFQIYPSIAILNATYELAATITAGKTAVTPTDPDFSNEGLIGTILTAGDGSPSNAMKELVIVNDTFLITQDVQLMVFDTYGSPVNWQCRFETVKMSGSEEAATNYRQFTISDGS